MGMTFASYYGMHLLPPVKHSDTIVSAGDNVVLREQLEYLLEHITGCRADCCAICNRYYRIRTIMLEMFTPRTVARIAGCGAG